MYIFTRTQYPRHTRTYKQYTRVRILGSRNTRTYKSKRIDFEHICCLEKNILFLLCPEKKIFWLSDCEKKISGFLSEENKKENLEEKTKPPPPQKIKWSVPKDAFRFGMTSMANTGVPVYLTPWRQAVPGYLTPPPAWLSSPPEGKLPRPVDLAPAHTGKILLCDVYYYLQHFNNYVAFLSYKYVNLR